MDKGGVKTMSVAQISDTSKLIKEKMDVELREIIASFDLCPDFFISSNSLRKMWATCFSSERYAAPLDLFIQAFDSTVFKEVITSDSNPDLDKSRRATVKWLFSCSEDIALDQIVNLTDFVELGTLLRMFEVDMLDQCAEKLRAETSVGMDYTRDETISRIQESINAKYSSTGNEMTAKL